MNNTEDTPPLPLPLAARTIVLVGMPGSGKSTIGRKLAQRLGLAFSDSDAEVEKAAGMTVPQIFETLGEPAFREGERKVIARLLRSSRQILSTGGGAFMNEHTRAIIKNEAISIWLQADYDVLLERVLRTDDRPLLRKGDPAIILRDLMNAREPIYAMADLTVRSENVPTDETTRLVINALEEIQALSATPQRCP